MRWRKPASADVDPRFLQKMASENREEARQRAVAKLDQLDVDYASRKRQTLSVLLNTIIGGLRDAVITLPAFEPWGEETRHQLQRWNVEAAELIVEMIKADAALERISAYDAESDSDGPPITYDSASAGRG